MTDTSTGSQGLRFIQESFPVKDVGEDSVREKNIRHAYFTGADQPYERLQRALRVEIYKSTWAAMYSTTSYPFEKLKSGKIAVKVINHYGDEALKVYEV